MSDFRSETRLLSFASDARLAVSELIRDIVHEVRGPLTAMVMDLHSLHSAVDQLNASLGANADPEQVRALTLLKDVHTNLERATSRLTGYVSTLKALGIKLSR